jgi:ABC-type uncharacterized transport system permease subunit
VVVTAGTIIVLLVALATVLFMGWVLSSTRVGTQVRAISELPVVAELLGVPLFARTALVWGFTGLVSAVGMIVVASNLPGSFSSLGFLIFPAMAAALEFLEGVGMDRIAGHTHALAGRLRQGAEALGMKMFTPPRNPSAIVSFHHGLDPERLSGALADAGVAITFQEEGRLLRAAVGMFNNDSDVDRLIQVLARSV